MDTQLQGRKLYHIENVFFLVTASAEYEIEEPIGWDKVLIQVKFDKSTFGYRFEFSDKDALLEFDISAGMDVLEQIWNTQGSEGFAVLRFGERVAGEFTTIFEAELNFESFDRGQHTIKMNVERKSFNDRFRTRFDYKTDLNAQFALDGLLLTPMAKRDLFLHPRLLSHNASFIYNKNVPVNPTLTTEEPAGIGNDALYKTTVPPFKVTSQNIEGISEPLPPEGTLIYAGFTLPAGITKRSFSFSATVSFKFTMGNTSGFIQAGFSIYKRSNISGGNNGDLPPIADPPSNDSYLVASDEFGNVAGTKYFSGTINGIIDLLADEAIFVKCWIWTPNDAAFDISNFEFVNTTGFKLTVKEQTVFSPSLVTTPRIHEAVNRQLEIILNSSNPLKSDFLGRLDLGYAADGCAANHHVMNGLLLRAFEGKPFNLSAKDWFNGLSSLFCMGLSVERDAAGNEWVRFEELSYFFRDVLLMDLPVISNYNKTANMDMTFNELNVAFKKYPQDNQQDSIEDWMTAFQYRSFLSKIKNTFSKTIDFILSPYYIEYTRQEAFKENPSNAYETDNDIFLISAKDAEVVTLAVGITFDNVANTITISKILPFVAGDFIKIENATGGASNGVFEIERADIPFAYTTTVLTIVEPLPTTGAGTGDVTVTDINGVAVVRSQAKRNEDFAETQNVTFPLSVYNLEHHVKRILLRWAKFFQAGWDFWIGDSSKGVAFLEGKNNIMVATRLKPEVACSYGDPSKGTIYDRAFEPATDQFMNNPIFGKSQFTFKAPMSWEKFQLLTMAFEGRHPDGLDYGYLQWTNPKGEVEKGFVFGMKFHPIEQMITFEVVEKFAP